MKNSTLRRYMLTALDMVQNGLDIDSHPDLRSREARKTIESFDRAVTGIDTLLGLPDTFRVEGGYHVALGKVEEELEEACRVMGHLVTRLQKVPETPIRHALPVMSRTASSIEKLSRKAWSNVIMPRPPKKRMASSFDVSLDEYLDSKWEHLLSTGKFILPSDIKKSVLLRPEAATKSIRRMVPPLTADHKRMVTFSLQEIAGIPNAACPRSSHWMSLYSGMIRRWEQMLRKGCCCRSMQKKVLLSKTHRASPQIPEGGEYVVYSGETFSSMQEIILVIEPGQPFFLQVECTLKEEAYRSLIKSFVVWPDPISEEDEDLDVALRIDQTQAALHNAREDLESSFGYGDVSCQIGQDSSGAILFNVEATRCRNISLPQGEDRAQYLVSLHSEDRNIFGLRDEMKDLARLLARETGVSLSDVYEVNSSTRTLHTYGMGVWWEIPPSFLSAQTCLDLANNFVSQLGRTGTRSEELHNYLKNQGIPSHEDPVTTIHDSSDHLSGRIRTILDDPTLALPRGVKNNLTILMNRLQDKKVRNREELVAIIPAKLDFVSTHFRKASPRLVLSEEELVEKIGKKVPSFHQIKQQMKVAGVNISPLSEDKVLDMIRLQASRDLETYRYSSKTFCVRVAHGDFTASNRVLGDWYQDGVSTVVRNRNGYLEYEVSIS